MWIKHQCKKNSINATKMLLGEWQRFNKVGWRWLNRWTRLRHFMSLIFKLLLEGKNLWWSYEIWWGCFLLTHKNGQRVAGDKRETQYVVYSFIGLWTTKFHVFISDFYTLHYRYSKCSILSKKDSRILIKKMNTLKFLCFLK
jgi:hypothetical protein